MVGRLSFTKPIVRAKHSCPDIPVVLSFRFNIRISMYNASLAVVCIRGLDDRKLISILRHNASAQRGRAWVTFGLLNVPRRTRNVQRRTCFALLDAIGCSCIFSSIMCRNALHCICIELSAMSNEPPSARLPSSFLTPPTTFGKRMTQNLTLDVPRLESRSRAFEPCSVRDMTITSSCETNSASLLDDARHGVCMTMSCHHVVSHLHMPGPT